jgi:predicted nucleic acid-binding protein
MIILDTNVISALMRSAPDEMVLQWLDRQPESSIWTTSVTVMEIRYGIQMLPAGQRRERMKQEMEAVLREEIEGRHIPFDVGAAERAAILMAERKLRGRPVEFRDTMIAGIVLSRNAVLATRNTAHFSDLGPRVINPWTPKE